MGNDLRAPCEADEHLELWLRRLGINMDLVAVKDDVRLVGKLHGLTIRGRFLVDGPVPIHVARWIYAADVEKKIHVAGHCGAPSPDEFGTVWRDAKGRIISVESENNSYEKGIAMGIREQLLAEYVFVRSLDDAPDRRGFVESYHICSGKALELFVAMVRVGMGGKP